MKQDALLKILQGVSVRSVLLEDSKADLSALQSEYSVFDPKEFLREFPEMKKTITPKLIDAVNKGLEMLKIPRMVKCIVGNYRDDYHGVHEDNYFASVTGGTRAQNFKVRQMLKLLFDKCGVTIHDDHEKGNAVRFLFDPVGGAVTEGIDAVVCDMALDDRDSGHAFSDYHDFEVYLRDMGYSPDRNLYDLYLKILNSTGK